MATTCPHPGWRGRSRPQRLFHLAHRSHGSTISDQIDKGREYGELNWPSPDAKDDNGLSETALPGERPGLPVPRPDHCLSQLFPVLSMPAGLGLGRSTVVCQALFTFLSMLQVRCSSEPLCASPARPLVGRPQCTPHRQSNRRGGPSRHKNRPWRGWDKP